MVSKYIKVTAKDHPLLKEGWVFPVFREEKYSYDILWPNGSLDEGYVKGLFSDATHEDYLKDGVPADA
jgi:hypothetical protein